MAAIEKMVLRKVWKMKVRTIGIAFVVAVAAAMFISGLYTADVLDYSTQRFVDDAKMPDMFIEFTEQVNASDVDRIMASEGIDTYNSRLSLMGSYSYEGEVYVARMIGIEDPTRKDMNIMEKAGGELFSGPGEGIVIAGSEAIGAGVGKTASFMISGQTINISITGTVRTPEFAAAGYMAESSVPMPGNIVIVFVHLEYLENLVGPGVNEVNLLLDGQDGDDVETALSSLGVKSVTYQKDTTTVRILKIGVDKMRYMFPMFSVVFMLVGFISIFMTMYRLVMNDSKYIGVLMSLGYSQARITQAYLTMGVLLSTIGFLLGSVFGFLFTIGIVAMTVDMLGSFPVHYPLNPLAFILGLAFVFGSVMISVGIPVVLVTRTTVRAALDYKPRSKIHTFRFGSQHLSRSTMMGIRNTTRNPLRTGITIMVIGMTIGVAGSWLVMTGSAWGYMEDSIKSEDWDLRADFFAPVDTDSVEATLALENFTVDEYVPYTSLGGTISKGSKDTGAVIMAGEDLDSVKNFNFESGKMDLSGALISNRMADEIGAGVGDTITISIGMTTTQMKVTGVVYEVILVVLYTSPSNLNMFFPEENSTGVYMKVDDKDQHADLAKELRANPLITKVAVKEDVVAAMNELLDTANSMLLMFFGLSLIITFVVSGSAVILSTMERDVEFATLDTLGVKRINVIKSLMVEMSVLGIVSAAVGVPCAYLFAWIFAILMAEVLFYFPVVFVMYATIATFFAGLAFVMVSSVVPVRYSGKLDTEKTIRERMAG